MTSVSFAASRGTGLLRSGARSGASGRSTGRLCRYRAGVPGARFLSYRGDWVVIEVTGDLDLASSPALRHEVLALLNSGQRSIVLDLTSAGFLDSLGLGTIVAVWKRVRVHGGSFALVCPEPRLQRVFKVVDIDRILPLHATVDDALAHAGSDRDSVSERE
jgi:anti-sigma B factor antagonist